MCGSTGGRPDESDGERTAIERLFEGGADPVHAVPTTEPDPDPETSPEDSDA